MLNKEVFVPENTILVVPHYNETKHEEILFGFAGNAKRDWFGQDFYYCLPLTIGNQYGFGIKSIRTFSAEWDGTDSPATITILDDSDDTYQSVENVFGKGIITIQNRFSLRTPPGINLMTIQPPNIFIPGLASMTGVIESDNLARDFSFSVKMTVPGKITVNSGDVFAAFIPIPRYFVDSFNIKNISEVFDESIHYEEQEEFKRLVDLRMTADKNKKYGSGRLYFYGMNSKNEKFKDHQGGKIV